MSCCFHYNKRQIPIYSISKSNKKSFNSTQIEMSQVVTETKSIAPVL